MLKEANRPSPMKVLTTPPWAADRLQHGLEILVQRRHQFLRRQVLGDGGEARDVGEQDGRLAGLAGQRALALAAQDGRRPRFRRRSGRTSRGSVSRSRRSLDHAVELAGQLADLVVGGDRHPHRRDRRRRPCAWRATACRTGAAASGAMKNAEIATPITAPPTSTSDLDLQALAARRRTGRRRSPPAARRRSRAGRRSSFSA